MDTTPDQNKQGNIFDNFISSGLTIPATDQRYYQVRLVNILALVGGAFMLIFGFLNFASGQLLLGVIEVGLAVILLSSLIFIRQTGNIYLTSSFASLSLMLLTMLIITTGGFENTGVFWVFSFPGILLFLWGFRKGVFWILGLFGAIVVIILLNYLNYVHSPFSVSTMLIFQLSLLFTSGFLLVYQRIQERSYEMINQEKGKQKALYEVTKMETRKINIILRSIGDGVIVIDSKRRIVLVNDVALKLSGHKRMDIIEQPYREKFKFVFEKDHTENTQFIDDVFANGVITTMSEPTMLVRSDGTELAVGDSASPIKNQNGEIEGCVIVFRDVTKEREVDKMKTEFVSLASHQLKTPLTEVKLYAELLNDPAHGALSEKQREFLKQITESNERMVNLVSEMLDVTRMETGKKFDLNRKPTDLNSLLNKLIEEYNKIGEERGVSVELSEFEPQGWSLYVDSEKMYQVFSNLMSNAVKYSKDNTTVQVGYRKKEDSLEIFFKDAGIGIPMSEQSHIFEKLYRANNAREQQKEGTGLGLYLVKGIVEAHGGTCTFESEENKGTTFFVALPLGSNENTNPSSGNPLASRPILFDK